MLFQGEVIFSWYSSEGRAQLADRWGGRVRRVFSPGLGRGSVNISSVRETDAGLYRCRVTFPNRTPPARNNGTFYYLDVDGDSTCRSHELASQASALVYQYLTIDLQAATSSSLRPSTSQSSRVIAPSWNVCPRARSGRCSGTTRGCRWRRCPSLRSGRSWRLTAVL